MVKLTELLSKISEFARIKYKQEGRISEIKKQISNSIEELNIIEIGVAKKIIEDKQTLNLAETTLLQIKTLIFNSKSTHPWLAQAFADVLYMRDDKICRSLKSKSNPAPKAADAIRLVAKEKRELLRELKEYQYKINYYEALFPKLEDFVDEPDSEDSQPIITDGSDKDETLLYITKDEYKAFDASKRNQMALDRYKRRNHSKEHIGKVYERYVGYLYEKAGYEVEYFGIKNGLSDLGRDLICKKDNHIFEVVQCKCWSSKKQIHENTICQLYGTMTKYKMENSIKTNTLFSQNVKAVFVGTTKLSDTALEFAAALGVECRCVDLSFDYPIIKCNVGKEGEKIYHLPFDQQYDSTIIEKHKGEFYASTVREAEQSGFRRAKRWMDETFKKNS